jgi:predicted nucleic acid-binding protein
LLFPVNLLTQPPIILDTNIFVAAGFKSSCRSAQIVEQVRSGDLRMVWNEETLRETEFIVCKIPPLRWEKFSNLFLLENCYGGPLFPQHFQQIPDRADIKFAALAEVTGAILITMDRDFLGVRETLEIAVMTPYEFAVGPL